MNNIDNIDIYRLVNLHHLELFYYVARHGGIVRACQNMPYTIQQPAMSAQIIRLEEDLGLKLFHRRPFALTKAGKRLYDFAAPFFGRLEGVEEMLREEVAAEVRIAGTVEVMRDHLPEIMDALRKEVPGLRVNVMVRNQADSQSLLERGEVDLAVTVLERTLPASFQSLELVSLPMVLLVLKSQNTRSAAELLKAKWKPPLIALPGHEMITRIFLNELESRRIQWPVTFEATGIDLVAHYVLKGLGCGLSVRVPGMEMDGRLRQLSLEGFPQLPIGIFWKGSLQPVAARFVECLKERAYRLKKQLGKGERV